MQFSVLGSLELVADGQRHPLAGARQQALLAALLVRAGEPASADWLVDAVWEGSPPTSSRISLRSHLSRLRRTLDAVEAGAGDAVVTEPSGYRLDLVDHDLDAARFETLLSQARRPGVGPVGALEALDAALELWRGPAYGELADRAFARAEAVRLEELRAAAAATRVDVLLALCRHDEALSDLEATVAADPLDERRHGQLMLALYRANRQAEALETYLTLQRRLAEELGVDPSPPLQALHEQILRHEPALAPPALAIRASGREGRGALFGRSADVEALAGLVGARSLVTLVGPGGVGKSRLAEEVVAGLVDAFPDGVLWCALSAVREPHDVSEAVIDALGLQRVDGRSADELLVHTLGRRRVLIVVDNCEHVLQAVTALAARIRAHCPNAAVLATSRQPLQLHGERVWVVTPLATPSADASAGEVTKSPAGALFCARAANADPGFVLTEGDAGPVAEICRRLDGLPLAIELAAARVNALTPSDIASRLGHRFELLTAGRQDDEARHRTLRAVVDWSYDLLEDRQARLFDRLSAFAGAFTLAAAERVCASDDLPEGTVAGVLADLVDRSMVVVERVDDGVRYRLLDTLRDYAARQLNGTAEADRVRREHATYVLGIADALAPELRGPGDAAAARAIESVIDDLRVAHAWAMARGDVDLALRLPVALHDFAVHRLRLMVAGWADRALTLPDSLQHPAGPAALALVAWGASCRRDLDRAHRLGKEALSAADPDSGAAARALHVLAETALLEGRPDDCLEYAERWIALARRLDSAYDQANAGVVRVLALLYAGDRGAALREVEAALGAAEEAGGGTVRAWALVSRGEALADVDPRGAEAALTEAIELARRAESGLVQGVALVSRAALLGRTGDTGRALAAFREAIIHWRRLGNPVSQVTALRNLVGLLVVVGADEAAALLHGAVTSAAVPTEAFGVEAERLDAAWSRLVERLGQHHAESVAEQGRRMTFAEAVDAAVATLELGSPTAGVLEGDGLH